MGIIFGKVHSAHMLTSDGVTDLLYFAAPRPPRVLPWLPEVSCEHPIKLNITALCERPDVVMCLGCSAQWCTPRAAT